MNLPDRSSIQIDMSVYAKLGIVPIIIILIVALPASCSYLALSMAGASYIGWGAWINYLSIASRSWPIVQGVIIENSIGAIEVPGRWIGLIDYFPIIAYRYDVNGVTYVSRRIALFPSDLRVEEDRTKKTPYKDIEDVCAQYPLNTSVNVHYKRNGPKDGVLIVGALSRSKQHSIVFFVLGSFLLLLGGFLFYVAA